MRHAPTTNGSDDHVAGHAGDLRVVDVRTLNGPSVAHLAPVVIAELRAGRLAALAPIDAPDFVARLLGALPALAGAAHTGAAHTGAAHAGGAEPSHSGLPRSWGDALVHTSLELQRMAGSPATFGRVVDDAPAEDRWMVAVGFDEEELATEAIRAGARVLRDCLRGDDPEIAAIVAELTRVYQRARPGPTTQLILEAARRRGIPVRRNRDDRIVQLGLGVNQRRLQAAMTDRTSAIATQVASDRRWTKRVLKRVGVAVPDGDTARTLEGALAIAEEIGFPVLLKPMDPVDGRGISGRIDTLDGVREAWPHAVAEHPVVVVERFVQGNDHRVLVVNRRVVACVERMPAHVVGDGRRTIRALAEAINRDPGRSRTDPSAWHAPLPLDERTVSFLASGGRTLDSLPNEGEIVHLRATASISTGGTAIDRTDEMHPVNRVLCELAAGAVGPDVAGVDVLTPDISVPFADNGAVVIEIDASPEIRLHTHPDHGIPRDVPGAILDMLYPPGAPATIPVIAITGTNGKTTTSRLVAHLFRHAGRQVGFTTTDGIYFQEHMLLEGDFTGPFAANVILSHREVEVAVLETARGGILRAGLGYDTCDVAVVLNVTADHLGIDGIDTVEQLADVKGVLAAVVKPTGHAVLSADDPLVLRMRERTPGTVVLFTKCAAPENAAVTAHLARGGAAICVEREGDGEQFVLREGERRTVVASVAEVPLTFGGAARFQLENVLAAIAVAHVQRLPVGRIREGLRDFIPSLARTPGRLNFFETDRGRVILDYAHNAAAVAGLLTFVARMPAEERIAVLSVPGDRRDEDLRAVGRLAAGMDYVVCKEHGPFRRGRTPGEGARLLAEGLLASGFPSERVAIFDNEPAAVQHALDRMRPGCVVVLTADSPAVLEQFLPYLTLRSTDAPR